MTIRHYALGFAVLVLAVPLLALMFFLLPVLLPLMLTLPFIFAAVAREAAKPDLAVQDVAEPTDDFESNPTLVLPLRREVGTPVQHAA